MNDSVILTVIPELRGAIASFGSGDGPTGGTGKMNARGKGNSGKRLASSGSKAALAGKIRRAQGGSAEQKKLASALNGRKNNHTNKSIAQAHAALNAAAAKVRAKQNKAYNKPGISAASGKAFKNAPKPVSGGYVSALTGKTVKNVKIVPRQWKNK